MTPSTLCCQTVLNRVPNVFRRWPCDGAVEIFLGRYRSPAIENLTRLIDHKHTGLEEALGMFDLPVGTALQKLGFSAARIKGQPIALVTNAWDFLVWVTDILKVKVPMSMCLIGEILRFAGYGIDFTACCANFVDNAVVNIAP